MLIFDLSRAHTLSNLKTWLKEVKDAANSTISLILVGNKCDLDEKSIEISSTDIEEFTKENDIKYFETSAKIDKNINRAFTELANIIHKKVKNGAIDVMCKDSGVRRENNLKMIKKGKTLKKDSCKC